MSSPIDKVRTALDTGSDDAIWSLAKDDATCFWVDWRGEDEAIVNDCERLLHTGKLAAEIVDADNEMGFEMFINYESRRVRVPLVEDVADRHITIHSLNQVLAPDFEIRAVVVSLETDSIALLPLPTAAWRLLSAEFPNELAERFLQISDSPNLFTDPISLPNSNSRARSRTAPPQARIENVPKNPWWRFWT